MAIRSGPKTASPRKRHDGSPSCTATKPSANGTEASEFLAIDLKPIIQLAQITFRRELPELLRQRNARRQWVAYEGSRRLGFAVTKHELVKKCLRQGIERGNLYVRSIAPETPDAEILFDV